MKKILNYTHPAYTREFDLSKNYELDELLKTLKLDQIKVMFAPVNFKWEDLEPKKKKQQQDERVD